MRKILRDILSSNGKYSNKRVIIILSFLLIAIAFISNLYFGKTVPQFMFETMSYIVMFGFGATASELFSKKGNSNNEEEK